MIPTPVYALIVAAGRGSRAGGGLPKQYRLLGGLPVLRRSVTAFHRHAGIERVQVVIHPDDRHHYDAAVGDLGLPEPVAGGATRAMSVRRGLEALFLTTGQVGQAVLIHDAARPLVSVSLIDRCLAAVPNAPPYPTIAFAPALPVTDSIRRIDDTHGPAIAEVVDRDRLVRMQTPQCFGMIELAEAYDTLGAAAEAHTDEAALMIAAGHRVTVISGDERNIKLTTPDDFARAEAMLAARASFRTGMGFDVHASEPGDHVWIGGIRIPHDRALKGHSDADVALHALTDALLGAISAGDIGAHFPPSDPQWRGARSHLFLDHARRLVEDRGGLIEHVDVTIICEAPTIGPHRETMRARIAEILRLPLSQVSVKATTTERLGFTGRGEGIAAQAVATVRLEERD